MKYLFVVQGEGRGHLTQAIRLMQLLEKHGHEVVSVMIGCSRKRSIPPFFKAKIGLDLVHFQSPNFMPVSQEKKPYIWASLLYNILLLPTYIESILSIRKTIKEKQPDIVINLYDLLCGITYGVFKPAPPMVNIAHQYFFLTSNFKYSGNKIFQFYLLNLYSKLTTLNASRILALSFRNEQVEQYEPITVVPPLIRDEILDMQTSKGEYIHGYLLNDGFVAEVLEWSNVHREVKLHFFWDKHAAERIVCMNDNLTMHALSDDRFIKFMAGAKAFATTGGFESVCEALYLQKPVLMVPVHIEQECNVIDALNSGVGVWSAKFDLDALIECELKYEPNAEFRIWANAAERVFLHELTSFELCENNVYFAI